MSALRPAHALQLVLGLVLLAATFTLLSSVIAGMALLSGLAMLFAWVPGFLLLSGWFYRSAAITLPTAMNVIWLLLILGLFLYGIFRSKPGYVAAPLVFCALWFGASLMDRKAVETRFAAEVWATPVAPEARGQRTLIVDAGENRISPGLTDRHIDRLIRVSRDGTEAVRHIQETDMSACAAQRQGDPGQRQAAKCVTLHETADIPDGLVVQRVRPPPRPVLLGLRARDPRAQLHEAFEDIRSAAADPRATCKETQARLRERGQERVLFSWSQCQPSVRAYIPWFGFSDRPRVTPVWGFALGPFHDVVYGPADITPEAMINAIYEVDMPAQPGSRAAGR